MTTLKKAQLKRWVGETLILITVIFLSLTISELTTKTDLFPHLNTKIVFYLAVVTTTLLLEIGVDWLIYRYYHWKTEFK